MTAKASRWYECVRFDRFKIVTLNLPLYKQQLQIYCERVPSILVVSAADNCDNLVKKLHMHFSYFSRVLLRFLQFLHRKTRYPTRAKKHCVTLVFRKPTIPKFTHFKVRNPCNYVM